MSQKPTVVVGCPVFERAWILPRWLDALAAQQQDVNLRLVSCVTPGKDATLSILEEASARFPSHVIHHPHQSREDHSRDWNDPARVGIVADKRNRLLDWFGDQEWKGDEYFLMLDSDVLVPPGGIKGLIDTIRFDGFDAVCPKVWIWGITYMAGKYVGGKLTLFPRRDRGVHAADVLTSSACLMVNRLADDPDVRYGVAERGKDFGWATGHEINGLNCSECVYWSREAKKRSYRLGVNCGLTFDHKMKPEVVR